MTLFLPDTNIWIDALRHPASRAGTTLEAALTNRELAMSTIVLGELLVGAALHARTLEQQAVIRQLALRCATLNFDSASAEHYGEIRAHLRRAGTPIGPNDLLIAATALAHNAVLVTHNTREFGRIPGLRIEDWQAAPSP